jgi:pimeloyl-ACP methyl ester carboxylesterase
VKTSRAGPLFVYEWGERDRPALLYWDGLGGTGLHANELGPLLAEEHGLRVIAPDPPGHGRSPAPAADELRPSRLAATAATLLSELGVDQAAFLGFSWGCAWAAGSRRGTRSGSRRSR